MRREKGKREEQLRALIEMRREKDKREEIELLIAEIEVRWTQSGGME